MSPACHRKDPQPAESKPVAPPSASPQAAPAPSDSSASASRASSHDPAPARRDPDDFYRAFTGTIASRPVEGALLIQGGSVRGSYSYSKKGAPAHAPGRAYDLHLLGRIDGPELQISEFTARPELTGYLQATLTADGRFEGTWTSPDRKKTYPLSWQLGETFGRAGSMTIEAFDMHNPHYSEKEHSTLFSGELIAIDRRKGSTIYNIERSWVFTVGDDACEPGDSLIANPRYTKDWPVDPAAIEASYKKLYPADNVVAFDVRFDACVRDKGGVNAIAVVEKPDGELRSMWSFLPMGTNEIKSAPPKIATLRPATTPAPGGDGCIDVESAQQKGSLVGKVADDIDGSGNYFLLLDKEVCISESTGTSKTKQALLSPGNIDDKKLQQSIGKRMKGTGTFSHLMGHQYAYSLELQVDTLEPAK